MATKIYVVFDGPPGHEAPHFIEVEDEHGNSIGGVDHPIQWAPPRSGTFITDSERAGHWRLGPFYLEDPDDVLLTGGG